MKNFKKVLVLFAILVSSFIFAFGCAKNQKDNSVASSETTTESVTSESVVKPLKAPTLTIESMEGTVNSIRFELLEDDPNNCGEITALYIGIKDEEPIYAQSTDQREFTNLYSDKLYYLTVIYTYDIGKGEVSETIKKGKYTKSVEEPQYSLSYESNSLDTISFEIEENDPSDVSTISKIEIVSAKGGESVTLENVNKGELTGLEPGQYILKVTYTYNLNEGGNDITKVVEFSIATKITGLDIPDFIVEVPEDKDPIILQLSDTQIIDAAQIRPGRDGVDSVYWWTDKLEQRLVCYLRETIEAVKPDLIIITGDLIYGEFDDKGTSLINLINAMDSFGIPWAPVFGNHDQESRKGANWQCEQLENSKYCLFRQRELTGNGNYTVGIAQGGVLTRVFFMMDSNGCGNASAESLANRHTKKTVGFGNDQIAWFEEIGELLSKYSPETKVSFAFHIQIAKFAEAYKKYDFINYGTQENPINIDTHPNKADGDFGYIGRDLKGPWDNGNVVYDKMVAIGCDSIYVGHEHCNSASVVYEGVRFQFSQKISTYDRCNWLMSDGSIIGSYPISGGEPIMGGTVNVLDDDGSIKDGYIYYCNGVDPSKSNVDKGEKVEVNGIAPQKNESAVTVKAVEFNGVNAYKCTAVSQGKVFIDPSLVANKSIFTFTVFIPKESNVKLNGYGEFAIRTKPNEIDPIGSVTGYIEYNSLAEDESIKLVFGEWKTYTVDVSTFGNKCTEFAFVIAKGNTIYLRDMAVL